MFQKGSLINSNLCQEVMIKDESFYVIFPVPRGKDITYVSAKIKGAIAELSSIRSPVRDIVIDRLKRNGLNFYECTSVEDFDMKFTIYKLTEDPDSFKESYEET